MQRNLSPVSSPFRAGEFFKNVKKWQTTVAQVKQDGGHIPPFLEEAIAGGGVNVRHKSFTNPSANEVVFRGKHYRNEEHLLSKNFRNSRSIRRNISQVSKEIVLLEECGAISQVSEQEALSAGSIVSPILWVTQKRPDGKFKSRLIHHDILNYQYSRPKFTLTEISAELDILAEFLEIEKHDLVSKLVEGIL